MVQRRKVILGTAGAAAGLAAAGCSSASGAHGKPTTADSAAGTWQSPSAAALQLTVPPAAGAANVSPAKPVVVAVSGGKLQSVTVTAGKDKVSGAVQSDGTWKSTDDLAYGKTYRVTASILDGAGAPV